jgi:hypothetical protein
VKEVPLDAGLWMRRIVEAGLVEAPALESVSIDGVPASYAALGYGTRSDGKAVRVAFSPRSGGDAVLAALSFACLHESEAEAGELLAIAPQWSPGARSLLGAVRRGAAALRAVGAESLGEKGGAIEPEPLRATYGTGARRVADLIARPGDREVFLRALTTLAGLAAKHGGAVRSVGDAVELVLLARRVAVLGLRGGRVQLETYLPDRDSHALDAASLATALDRLEGSLRKRLNDRKICGSEEELRAALLPILERAVETRWSAIWPLGGSDPEVIDLAAVRADGTPVLAAARQTLALPGLASILEATLAAGPALASLLARADVPVRAEPPQLLVAARTFEAPVLAVLAALELPYTAYDVATRRNGALSLEPRTIVAPAALAPRVEPVEATAAAPARTRRETADEAATPSEGVSGRFEEISLFDLSEDTQAPAADAEVTVSRRRRGRGRRRGRRGRGAEGDAAPSESADAPEASESGGADSAPGEGAASRSRGKRSRRAAPAAEPEEPEEEALIAADEEDDTLAPLPEDVPDLDEAVAEPVYDEEDEVDESETDEEEAQSELGRPARAAKVAPQVEPPPPPRPPRRRAAFVAHADRISVLTAVLLARDVRLVEGFWIYPQEDLMTFFRSVATDLREETPIFLVGFTASPPARDTLQAAALYRGRLDWYDHHDWPPEDLQSLREAIGEDNVHIEPGNESSVASVLTERTRRSRFSDKLVELITGRFTQHDYERWGRLWWHRIGELIAKPGERRSEIDPLLAGRPSDLAREAADVLRPPLPPELEYVSGRDFRLVHFGGFSMVVTVVPPHLDLHLTARIARERFEAQLSLAFREGEELVVLGGEEGRARRDLDLGKMADHLCAKHEWIEALQGDDHVARVRVRGLWEHADRLDEVIGEIAMGRSIVEA